MAVRRATTKTMPLASRTRAPRRFTFTLSFLILLASLAAGCGPANELEEKSTKKQTSSSQPAEQPLIKLVVIDDAAMGEAIVRRWATDVGGRVELKNLALEGSAGLSGETWDSIAGADAVIYPVGMLGELVERGALLPLPPETLRDRTLARREIFDFPRQQEATWGETVYAIPLGSVQLVLYYRADVFEARGLKPPATWQEYHEIAAALAGDSAAPLPAIEPLAPGWAGQVLLARAAPYARHRSQYSTLFNYSTMAPLIAGPPFVRALEELAATAKLPGRDGARLSPHEAREAFWAGRAGMALTWPTAAAPVNEETSIAVGFAELPGSPQAYNSRSARWEPKPEGESQRTALLGVSGRLASVTKTSRHAAAAFNLLSRASGDWSSQVAPLSRETTLFRQSHVAAPGKWVEESVPSESAKAYAELVARVQTGSSWLSSPQIPGRAEYMAALDEAVWQVVEEGQSPQAALDAAAEKWGQITERLGVEKQRKAYERSLGLEP
jgi:multiple sugar transport system substrate-binding protein